MANQGLGFGGNFKAMSPGFLNFSQEEDFNQMTATVPQLSVFGACATEGEASNAYMTKAPAESLLL